MSIRSVVTNEYFVLGLVVIIAYLVYQCNAKKSCDIEGMRNIDFMPIEQAFSEKPWFEKYYNKKLNKKKSKKSKKKSKFLERSDERYERYSGDSSDESEESESPKPLDTRPDLSQCQPCKCS